MTTQHRLKRVSLAVSLGLLANVSNVLAQDSQAENSIIEEVVVKATRLQGSAAAIVEERRNQAFVADILGAEQISKTGDGDAASALRRVTGLTLVDGKFVYVRGLGERYSSARLNGANIPSPDLTRNVIPLDIFPTSIIESLSVQKSYSPSMPAAFGGGAIDIRTKSVPKDFIANIELGMSYDKNSTNGYTYDRKDTGLSSEIESAIVQYKGDFSLRNIILTDRLIDTTDTSRASQAKTVNQNLLKSLPRDMKMKKESLNPANNIKASIGNSFDESYFGGRIGILAAVSYDNKWQYTDKKSAVVSENFSADCDESLLNDKQITNSCYNTIKTSKVTTENERYSGVINLGYKLDNHEFSWNNIYLKDSEDESVIGIVESPNGSTVNTIFGNGQAQRLHEFTYEERTLDIMQFIGHHTFTDYWGVGFDWQYTESTAETEIPTDVKFKFIDTYDNGIYQKSDITGDDNRVVYSYLALEDVVKSSSGNLTLPLYFHTIELELKAGYDLSDKGRYYTTSSFKINNESGIKLPVNNGEGSVLGITSYLTDELLDKNDIFIDFNEPTAPDADDYIAAQKIDAVYGAFDFIYQNQWRISGGVRYEEFKQTSLATSSLIFSKDDLGIFFSEEKISDGSLNENDYFSALSFTYIGGEKYQIRFGYGETIVRPDLREVVPVAYYDPLTDIRTIGRVGLESSPIKNYDARYEYYASNGDNYSVGLFYKDITKPIESVLSVGDEDYTLSFVNGKTAKIYGLEAEWLHDLTWLVYGLFTSGNITFSDSEVSIDRAFAGNLTNPVKRMTGHSEYVANLQLNYDSANSNHSSSLVYNVFGERIVASGVGGREDALEQPFHALDLVYTYYSGFNSQIKLKVKNLLDESQEVTQSGISVRDKAVGTTISLSYKYDF